MQKSFFSKAAISLLTALSLLASTLPAFAKPLPLSQFPNALYVVTSKDTPPAQTVAPGKVGLDVFHFDLYSRPHEGAKITSMDFQLTGTLNPSMLYDFTLFDPALQQIVGNSAVAVNGHVVFSNLNVSLEKYKPKKFVLYVDVANYGTSGATFGFLIDTINGYGSASANDLKLNKVKNWASNLFTVSNDANCVNVVTDSAFNSQILSPGEDVPVGKFILKNNCQSDISLSKLYVWVNINGKFPFNTIFLRNSVTKQSLTFPTGFYLADTNGTSYGTSFNLNVQLVISKGTTAVLEIVATDLLAKNWAGASTSGTVFSFSISNPEFLDMVTAEKLLSVTGSVQGPMMTIL